jgi:hypothetical protein
MEKINNIINQLVSHSMLPLNKEYQHNFFSHMSGSNIIVMVPDCQETESYIFCLRTLIISVKKETKFTTEQMIMHQERLRYSLLLNNLLKIP